MIRKSSKESLRRELHRKTQEFLSQGGEIQKCDPGETGEPLDKPRAKAVFVSPSPLKTRTYLNDVVSAVDARKRKNQTSSVKKPTNKPRKQIIYDDFGEPLREMWVDK
ncbi:MAG: hypothetical protein ACPG3V_04750 [Porticoccaceae bacterium]